MRVEYGKDKGDEVFWSSVNKGKFGKEVQRKHGNRKK